MTSSIGSWSCLRCADLVVAEAFQEKSYLRDPQQIAAATGKPLAKVLDEFDIMFNGPAWRESRFISKQDVFDYAEETKVSVYYYEGARLANAKLCRNSNGLAIVFASWCGNLYFFKGAGGRARDDLQRTTVAKLQNEKALVQPSQIKPSLAKSVRHLPKPVESFEPYPWHLDIADVPPGLYWLPSESRYRVEDCDPECCLPGLIKRMLKSKRYPLVSMQRYDTENKPHELTYHKNPHFDNGTGTIKVRSHAQNTITLAAFARRLDIPYAGQAAGSFMHQVIDTIVRRKQRRYLTDAEKKQILESQDGKCNLCGDCI